MYFSTCVCILVLYTSRVSCLSHPGGGSDIVDELQHNLTELQNQMSSLQNYVYELNKTNTYQQKIILTLQTSMNIALRQQLEIKNQTATSNQTTLNQEREILALQQRFKRYESTFNQTSTDQQKTILAHKQLLDHQIVFINKTYKDQQITISALETKLNGSIDRQQKFEQQMTNVNKTNTDLQQSISNLRLYTNHSISAYDIILHDVVSTGENITHNLLSLEKQVHDVVVTTNNISSKMLTLGKQVHYESLSMADVIQQMHTMNSSILAKFNNIVFTVSRTIDGALYNRIIIYDKVITNIGNAYSTQTGVFTCPSDGEYLFTWSVLSGSTSKDCDVFIYRNGISLLRSYSHEAPGSVTEASSNTIILSLVTGDKVWTQASNCYFYYGFPNTAFSGMKI